MNTARIEKQILLHAPLERVWHAISDAEQFGSWFGVAFDGALVAGARDRIPLARPAKAFAANEGGWAAQAKLIEKYLAGLAA